MHWFGNEPPETQDMRVVIIDEYDNRKYQHTVTIPARVDDPTSAIKLEFIEGDVTPPPPSHVQDWDVYDYEPL